MSITKKLVGVVCAGSIAAMLAFGLTACGEPENNSNNANNANANQTNINTVVEPETVIIDEVDADSPYASGTHHAVIKVEGYEPIEVELNADAAPITVDNFANLVEQGYYDGLTFYRFQDGFCMQGGTKGNSASGNDASLTPILGEFASNGVDNPLASAFGKGVIAMARTSDPDSATSTFFVTLADGKEVSMSLNDDYAAFGQVTPEGMAIIDKIVADHVAAAEKDPTGMGCIDDTASQAKIVSITMVD